MNELFEAVEGQLTYYDVLAILCSKVDSCKNSTQLFEEFFSTQKERIRKMCEKLPFLDLRNYDEAVLYNNLKADQLVQIDLYFQETNPDEYPLEWLTMICTVERLLDFEENRTAFLRDKICKSLDSDSVSEQYHRFSQLNYCTFKKYGVLLPKETCVWEKEGLRPIESLAMRPLSFLKKYLWIRPGIYEVVNLFTDLQINKKRGLRVACSPLHTQRPFSVSFESPHFYTNYEVEYEKVIFNRFCKTVQSAAAQGADILIFPEMMASKESCTACIRYIRETPFCGYVPLILLPTCEYHNGEQWVNELTGIDGDGNVLFTYNKQHPYQYDKGTKKDENGEEYKDSYFEPISADHKLSVLHVPNVGRIGFLICSDVLETEYVRYLQDNLQLTLLFHSTFSIGKDQLMRQLDSFSTISCDVVLCNACAAWDMSAKDSPYVGIYCSYGHAAADKMSTYAEECRQDCNGCVFILDISTEYNGTVLPMSTTRLGVS